VKLIAISHNDETKMCVVIVITNNPVNLLVQRIALVFGLFHFPFQAHDIARHFVFWGRRMTCHVALSVATLSSAPSS
jgi:hypothetical protein